MLNIQPNRIFIQSLFSFPSWPVSYRCRCSLRSSSRSSQGLPTNPSPAFSTAPAGTLSTNPSNSFCLTLSILSTIFWCLPSAHNLSRSFSWGPPRPTYPNPACSTAPAGTLSTNRSNSPCLSPSFSHTHNPSLFTSNRDLRLKPGIQYSARWKIINR